MRRLACDADIIPVVSSGAGVVLDEGRARRLATAEQRLVIEAMQATCSHPDCTVGIDDCRTHHLTPWRLGGRTDLADLSPVCEPHHHLIHEGGWSLTMTPTVSPPGHGLTAGGTGPARSTTAGRSQPEPIRATAGDRRPAEPRPPAQGDRIHAECVATETGRSRRYNRLPAEPSGPDPMKLIVPPSRRCSAKHRSTTARPSPSRW